MRKGFSHLLTVAAAHEAVVVEAVERAGGVTEGAKALGLPRTTVQSLIGRLRAKVEGREKAPSPTVVAAFAGEVPRAAPVPAAPDHTPDLLTLYLIGDHHIGMLAWGRETGTSWDTAEAERTLIGAMEALVARGPASARAAIVVLGDFFHYDGFAAVTPTHGHQLDSDSRFPRMAEVGVRCLRAVVAAALSRHAFVELIVMPGNHDPVSCGVWLPLLLQTHYEREPRVTVHVVRSCFHYLRHGVCLNAFHHGDRVKAERLPLLMAADRPSDWAATWHRTWWCGHIHHKTAFDAVGPVTVETVRVLPPPDAWGFGQGHRPTRGMLAVVQHAELGEVARYPVTPAMLAAAGSPMASHTPAVPDTSCAAPH